MIRSFGGGSVRIGGPGPHGGPWGPGGPGGPGFHHPYGSWYHGDWPGPGWAHPWHVGPVGWFSVGFVTGAVVWDAPWYWGYWPYYNPYYTEVIVIQGGTTIDYSRPIVVATPPAALPGSTSQTAADDQASQLLDAARVSFSSGDYTTALGLVNQAISRKPNDPVLHEFRGLILFATKQYKQAAATIYAVLSVGPGWDWATMSGFYANPETYTGQLRALEQYRNANLNASEVRFLLAYHYMTCGHTDSAQTELKEAVRLNPKDQLSSQLLAGLSSSKDTTTAPPLPSQTAVPAVPITAAGLAGNWEATRSTDESITFNLTADGTYSWKYVNKGKTQEFSGAYTVADNLLILKQGGNPTMIGQVSQLSPTQFNFKLAGNNPSDPGLTFSKK